RSPARRWRTPTRRRTAPTSRRTSGSVRVITSRPMRALVRSLVASQEAGLVLVVVLVTALLTLLAGSHADRATGAVVNNFWNSYTLIQTATDASFFAIMAIGATVVIVSGGIDLSVGSVYARSGVTMALLLRAVGPAPGAPTVLLALGTSVGVGLLCGLLNGVLITGLKVHPFIITLGTMWMLRGIAVSGLTAGFAAFLGASFYGSASSGDAQGYELYVIASAVVGGASLLGGKGSAAGALLGALLIVLIRQSIRTLHFDQNYEWIVI